VNVSNALPLPPPGPDKAVRRAVDAVTSTRATGDAAHEGRPPPRAERLEPGEREARGAEAQSLSRVERDLPLHVNRALNAYASVAGEERRESLRDMLGFDGYA
jgi:hypothetical protein